jgi:16S rRNA (cytidine1402-2'-O)-methyltransferase
MERCDAHSRKTLIQGWVKRAQAGEKFMLVTDAGTPSISDPGAAVVAAFAAEGLSVEALPGPSAVATALSLSGFESTAYTFWGFFGRSAADQSDALQRAEAVVQQGVRVHVWFESPERIAKTLATCAEEGNAPGIQVAAFRELTKRFETAYRGTLPEVARQVAASEERGEARGEWVVVLYWPSLEAKPPGGEKVDWESALRIALRAGAPTSAAAREVAAAFGVSRSEVYERATQMKKI